MSAPVLQFFYDTLFNNKSTIGPTGMNYVLINSIYLSFWGYFGETRTFSSPLKYSVFVELTSLLLNRSYKLFIIHLQYLATVPNIFLKRLNKICTNRYFST